MPLNLFKLLPASLKERIRRRTGAITLSNRLENLRRAGFQPRRIIDAGAFEGEWAGAALAVFPAAEVLMIEPQAQRQPALLALAGRNRNLKLRRALLGAAPGKVRFLVEGTNSRVIPSDWDPGPGSQIEEWQLETLADIAREEDFTECDFLKLDLQGQELNALAGAGGMFGTCEVILAEVSWLPIGEVPLAHEVIARFDAAGYRLYDVLGHNYRPLDGALWQTDFIFVRTDSRLLVNRNWA
jgi:FkbM family methyltransferase